MESAALKEVDPELFAIIRQEEVRQQEGLELIASENRASRAVMAAQGSVLTNKYAEGYPLKRYYGGCAVVDRAETLAIDRARELFKAEYANVQAHSGSTANMAAYFAVINPGDTVLAMDLSHGGHLTHGSPVSFSGRLFNFVHYGLSKETEMIDMDEVAALAQRHRPKLIVAGASAYPRIIDFKAFAEIARSVDALFMVDMAHIAGLVAAGVHPSPVPHADIVTSTTHKTLRGPRGGLILATSEIGPRISSQIFPGIQGGPLMHVIAAKAVALKEAQSPEFALYQQQVVTNAAALAQGLVERGMNLVSKGTDNHLMLVNLIHMDISGKEAENRLGAAGITVNKNAVPNDPRGPRVTSGIRLGTPLLTSRGMGVEEMALVADLVCQALETPSTSEILRKKVKSLCASFPLYGDTPAHG